MPPTNSGRVLILAEAAQEASTSGSSSTSLSTGSALDGFVQLPCPVTGQLQQYLVHGGLLQEVERFKSTHSSWLIDADVVSDGALYLCSTVDPLLLLLPHLEQGTQFTDAATLCTVPGCPAAGLLEELCRPHLGCVCDVKQVEEETFYRLNEAKALAWLTLKQRQVAAALQAVVPSSLAGSSPEEVISYSLGWLGEYLSPAWATKLAAHLGVAAGGATPSSTPATRAAPEASTPDLPSADSSQEKRHKAEDTRPAVDARKAAKKKAAASRAETQRAKFAEQAAGSRKISAFFGGGGAKAATKKN